MPVELRFLICRALTVATSTRTATRGGHPIEAITPLFVGVVIGLHLGWLH